MGSSRRPMVARPHFITPHAVDQFRARVADLHPDDVINELNRMLQSPGLPVDAELREGGLSLVYLGWLGSNPVYIPVTPPDEEHGEWPYVPTVYGKESRLHGKLVRTAAHKERAGRFPMRPWADQDDRLLAALRAAGFTVRQCSAIMRRGKNTILRHLGGPREPGNAWPARDVETAVAMRAGGKTDREIGQAVGRTESAVSVRLYRYRRAHPRDRRAVSPAPGPWSRADLETALAMRAEGRTLAEIGEAVHRSPATVSERLRRERWKAEKPRVTGPWTEAELTLAHDLRAEGRSYACIDRELGRTPGSTYRKFEHIRKARLSDPKARKFAALVGRLIREVRKEGIDCLPEPFSMGSTRRARKPPSEPCSSTASGAAGM